jgi:two-component system NarL family sensor kinase
LETGSYSPQPAEREEALFRIAQEAMNNIVKHAKARNVNLILSCEPGQTRLVIKDDGVGFDQESKKQKRGLTSGGGMGLNILRERAAGYGGTVEIRSRPGQGTVVEAILPESETRK